MNPNARLVCYGADLVGIFIFVLGSQVRLTFPWLGGERRDRAHSRWTQNIDDPRGSYFGNPRAWSMVMFVWLAIPWCTLMDARGAQGGASSCRRAEGESLMGTWIGKPAPRRAHSGGQSLTQLSDILGLLRGMVYSS